MTRTLAALMIVLLACAPHGAFAQPGSGAGLSDEDLIDQLQAAQLPTGRQPWNRVQPAALVTLGAPVNIGPREHPIPVEAPALAELIRRATGSLPALLKHLSDPRPTRIVFAVAPREGTWRRVVSSCDYDSRYSEKDRQPAGVNLKDPRPLEGDGNYRVKVGDLCYVAVGEIVDRQLYVIGWYGGSGGWPEGAGIGAKIHAVNSPVECPALAAAARADWAGLTPQEHEKLLIGMAALSTDRNQAYLGAIDRLLLYYPASGRDVVEGILEGKASPWLKESVVKELKPFRTPELNAVLYRTYRKAVSAQDEDLKIQPANSWDPSVASLGSILAVECAGSLLRQGHDEEFKAFAMDRVARIKDADSQPSPPASPARPGPKIDTLRFVHNYELAAYRGLLGELDETARPPAPSSESDEAMSAPTPGARVTIESVDLRTSPFSPLVVDFRLPDTPMARIAAARVVITRAQDDAGVVLEQVGREQFSYVSVGGNSDDVMTALPDPSLSVRLTSPSKPAKAVAILDGWVEAVVPDLDPDAVARVPGVMAGAGGPADCAALRRAGVSLTVFNKVAWERHPPAIGPSWLGPTRLQLGDGDVAVLVRDDKDLLISTEFSAKDGSPLRYNHNGRAHEGGLPGTRVDVYHFDAPLPDDAQMVCLLATTRSKVVAPFSFAGVALR